MHILAIVILVLLLIGQVRVGGRAQFDAQGFLLWIRLGWFRIKILPRKPRADKKSSPPKKLKKPKKEKLTTPIPERVGGALEYAQALLPVALEAAGGMWRGLRVDTLELEMTAGASDPADAAMLYGYANAALGTLWDPLTRAFCVKNGTARIKLDFNAPGITVYGTAELSIKIGTALRIGLRAGIRALLGALAARRRLKIKRHQRKAA